MPVINELDIVLTVYICFHSAIVYINIVLLCCRVGYDSLFATWNTTSFSPSDSFENYAKVIGENCLHFLCPFSLNCMYLISEKDSLRTDRDLDFFSDENIENVSTLERILKTFLILHPEFGEFCTCQSHKKSHLPPISLPLSLSSLPHYCFLSSSCLHLPCPFLLQQAIFRG